MTPPPPSLLLRLPVVTGSPATVADELQKWIEEADADGFSASSLSFARGLARAGVAFLIADSHARARNPALPPDLCYALAPGTFEDIVEFLVPELQRRGVFRTEYPARLDGKGLTAREGIYGVGQTKLQDAHYGSRYKWRAGEDAPALDQD